MGLGHGVRASAAAGIHRRAVVRSRKPGLASDSPGRTTLRHGRPSWPAGGLRAKLIAAEPESTVTEAVRSLEIRWIVPGELGAEMIDWFARFPAETESREDSYLLQPQLRGLSVKIRRNGPLQVKVYLGSPGVLDVAGRASGRMESWQKWSFPHDQRSHGSADPAGWRLVRKRRQVCRFPLVNGRNRVRGSGLGNEPECAVELTEVDTLGEAWWSLGFEVTGPAEMLRGELETTTAIVFADPPQGSAAFSAEHSRSFTEWLYRWPGAR
jgi:hypothetical protein